MIETGEPDLDTIFPPVGVNHQFPPVQIFRTGTMGGRVVAALACFPDGATLDKIAHRTGMCLDEVRPVVELLLRGKVLRLTDVPGHWRRGTWYEAVTLIHLVGDNHPIDGLFASGGASDG